MRGPTHTRQQALSTPEDDGTLHRHLALRNEASPAYRSAAARSCGGVDKRQGRRAPSRNQSGRRKPDSHQPSHRQAGNRHQPLQPSTARTLKGLTGGNSQPPISRGRTHSGRTSAESAAPARNRGVLHDVRHGSREERSTTQTGSGSHQRRLVGQPSGEPPPLVPQLPCGYRYLPGRRKRNRT